jgi:hypothetical protein
MFRLSATAAVFLGYVLSAATCPATGQEKKPEDKKAWQENKLKKFQGRWTTVRDVKADKGKIRRQRVDLEFADGDLKVYLKVFTDGEKEDSWDGSIKVMGVEQVGMDSRLILGDGKQKKAEIHYDFVGERLILVGRIGTRPWEGFRLSGEYKRVEKPK